MPLSRKGSRNQLALIEAALFGLLAAACWGVGDFLSRIPARRIGYYLTAGYLNLIGFIIFIPYYLVIGSIGLSIDSSNTSYFLLNILLGFFTFVGAVFLLKGYEKGIMSIVAPVVGTFPVPTILLSLFILGEGVSLPQAIGISIVISGIVLGGVKLSELRALGSFHSKKAHTTMANGETLEKTKVIRGFDSALIALLAFGGQYFCLGIVAVIFGPLFPIMVMRAFAAIFSFLLLKPLREKFKLPNLTTLLLVCLLVVFDTAAFLSFNFGVLSSSDSISIVVTLSGLFSAVTIVLARIFYLERVEPIQVLGIITMLIGTAAVLYF